jgi:SAM-dependent methyltransferase
MAFSLSIDKLMRCVRAPESERPRAAPRQLPEALLAEQGWIAHYKALQANFDAWEKRGFFAVSDVEDKNVLDFGGSHGELSVVLLQNGARQATVIDTSLPTAFYETKLRTIENLKYSDLSVEEYARRSRQSAPLGEFDVVVSHTVTEHVQQLASAFAAIYSLLKPGGLFFVVHDNYYHPSGAHDNAMLRANSLGRFEYPGPKCWESSDLCEASREYRRSVRMQLPWTWNDEAESMLTPQNCEVCLFYRRTKPWAHIIYQSQFMQVFPQVCFTTGQRSSELNKITPFQLKQHLLEARFELELWERTFVNDTPPEWLMAAPYYCNERDLKTLNVYARCRKNPSDS